METALDKTKEVNIEKYNHEENLSAIKKDLDYIKNKNAEYAIRIGKRLIQAKANVPHGKWLESLEELDFTHQTAIRLMKIADVFGDNPELINSMSQRRAYLLTTLPDDNIIQLKNDGLIFFQDGSTLTVAEYTGMAGKELENKLINLRNQKNAEIRESRDRADSAQIEMKTMKTQAEERQAFLEKLMIDSNEALANEVSRLQKLVSTKNSELDELKMTLQQNEVEQVEGEEALNLLFDIRKDLIGIFGRLNHVNLVKDTEVRSQYYSLIAWANTYIRDKQVKLDNVVERLDEYTGNTADDLS